MISEREMEGKDPQGLRARLLALLGGCRDALPPEVVACFQQLAEDICPRPDPYLIAARQLVSNRNNTKHADAILKGERDTVVAVRNAHAAVVDGAMMERDRIINHLALRGSAQHYLDELSQGDHWKEHNR